MNNLFDDYSSKIKNVYIELHDYGYIHGPLENSNPSRRFIGRKNVLERLRNILSNSLSKSGAYLITGYRGMGKSSFVNKAIDEVSQIKELINICGRVLRIFIFALILSIFNFRWIIYSVLLVIAIMSAFYIKFTQNLSNKATSKDKKPWKKIKELFLVINEKRPRFKLKTLSKDILQTLIILIFLYPLVRLIKIPWIVIPVILLAFLAIVLFNINSFVENNRLLNKVDDYKGTKKRTLLTQIITFFEDLYNYRKRIYIKINLGHDDLKEIDFLRLISRNISKRYNENRKLLLTNIFWKILFVVLIWFITIAIYHFPTIHNLNKDLKKNISLGAYLPSQIPFYLENEKDILNDIARSLNKSNDFTFENYLYSIVTIENLSPKEQISLLEDNNINHVLQRKKIDIDLNNYVNWEQIETLPLNTVKALISAKENLYNYIYENKDTLKIATFVNKMIDFRKNDLNEIPDSLINLNFVGASSLLTHIYSNKKLAEILHGNFNYILDLEFIFQYQKQLDLYEEINNFSKVKKYVASFLTHIDLFIYTGYSQLREFVPVGKKTKLDYFLSYEGEKHSLFKNISNIPILPLHPDYLFLLYFIITWILVKFVVKQKVFGKSTGKDICKKLKHLNEIIDSQVSTERNISLNSNKFFDANFRKSKQFPIADIRDIEKWLIEIIEDIEKLPRYLYKPEFIFVFDELDKIEPQNNVNVSEKSEEQQLFNNQNTATFSPEGTRNRQNTVLKLLSNLKYFLSTAKAKFIFIAGREMFDASLADVSDRNFFIGSIFHDVIYLQSFLTDEMDNKNKDITSMTEQYVCNFIMPHDYNPSDRNLQSYNKYLIDKFDDFNVNTEIAKQKREKIIYVLQHFITYLTHVSNGAPNKISRYFENFIKKGDKSILCSNDVLNVGNNYNNLYLFFDFQKQYTLGMINCLINPINLSINNNVKSYGDKLLVSASFLVDHLFKFHRNGFSWRNIEITPEIVDINKTPELRNFIAKIINYLTQTHINEIINGLFDFKFPKKISQEISYLSKISEEASAAFNFTLDESLSIKHYYQKLLSNLTSRYRTIHGENDFNDYIRSVTMIHMILGDLSYYDEEFGDASLEYLNSLQYFRKIKKDEFTPSLMVLYIRNMLKLGLTYEKRKTYESAFLTYGEVSSKIIEYRDISLDDLNLVVQHSKITDKRDLDKNYSSGYLPSKVEDDYFNEPDFLNTPNKTFTPQKEQVYFKLTSFEGIRLFFQSLLAKFQIIEKSNLGGITDVDIQRLTVEFTYLTKTIKASEKYLIEAEFWNKVGSILYYKSGLIHNIYVEKGIGESEEVKSESEKEKKLCENHEIRFPSCYSKITEIQKRKLKSPCSACKFYHIGLHEFLKKYIMLEGYEKYNENETKFPEPYDLEKKYYLTILLKALEAKAYKSQRKNSFKTLANLLSDVGDVYLSCSSSEDVIDKEFMENFLEFIKIKDYDKFIRYIARKWNENDSNTKESPKKLEIMLLYFYLAFRFYKKANERKYASYQLTKIISFLRVFCSVNADFKKYIPRFFDELENVIIRKSLDTMYAAYNNIHVQEIIRQKRIFSPKDSLIDEDISLNRGTINSEIDDIIYIFQDLKLKCSANQVEKISKSWKMNLISPFNLIDNIYNRILKWEYKANLNYEIIKILGFKDFKSPISDFDTLNQFLVLLDTDCENKNRDLIFADIDKILPKTYFNDSVKELLKFLITDSIFCLHEIIVNSEQYGKSFLVNHSFMSKNHKKLMFWSELYYLYLYLFDIIEAKKNNETELVKKKTEKLYKKAWFKYINMPNEPLYPIKQIPFNLHSKIEYFLSNIFTNFESNLKDTKIKLSTDINKKLSQLIGSDNIPLINTSYQCEKAIKEYYSAVETHTEGNAYKNLIEEMYYLNDDFNDNTFHFSVAIERFLLNSKTLDVALLKRKVKNSDIYKHRSYLNKIIDSTNI
ncbi:MAG: hypothetical protein GQ564_14470 [Bacteroidales bacterium]|nr:hypothetical protein [Bacteroidales bacterium]